jgi:hypothetical protein
LCSTHLRGGGQQDAPAAISQFVTEAEQHRGFAAAANERHKFALAQIQ